ncbi:uncharacterized protein V6R79_017920 [Siganus canaliculatus]
MTVEYVDPRPQPRVFTGPTDSSGFLSSLPHLAAFCVKGNKNFFWSIENFQWSQLERIELPDRTSKTFRVRKMTKKSHTRRVLTPLCTEIKRKKAAGKKRRRPRSAAAQVDDLSPPRHLLIEPSKEGGKVEETRGKGVRDFSLTV